MWMEESVKILDHGQEHGAGRTIQFAYVSGFSTAVPILLSRSKVVFHLIDLVSVSLVPFRPWRNTACIIVAQPLHL